MTKIFINAVLVFSFFSLQGCDNAALLPEPAVSPRIAVVEVLQLQAADWQQTIHTFGMVEAMEEVSVSVEAAGTIDKIYFKEGQRIARGEPLLDLDPGKRALGVDRARATVTSEAARLMEARSLLKRHRELVKNSLISQATLDKSESAVQQAAAGHENALASLALALRELDDSQVLSPVEGVIEQRNVEKGEVVLPGQRLATIQAVDVVHVLTYVSERDVNFLRVGAPAAVTSPGAPGRVFEANIVSIGVKADPGTGNFPVKLSLANAEWLLRAGMTARVELNGLLEHDRLTIPDTAVVDRNRRKVVYVLSEEDGRPIAREVNPLLRNVTSGQLPVIDGLSAGDQLIISGLNLLIDGTPVKVAPKTQISNTP
jgi:RND family efflux transporter MFP subunit